MKYPTAGWWIYITGVLPNLDVYNINQMTLEEFLIQLLDQDFDLKKGKYTLSNSFTKLGALKQTEKEVLLKRFKGSVHFIKALEMYLNRQELSALSPRSVIYHNKTVYSEDEILDFLSIFKDKPLQEKTDLLNKRLISKIKLVNEREQQEKETISLEVKKFKDFFGKKQTKINLMDRYLNFLYDLMDNRAFL